MPLFPIASCGFLVLKPSEVIERSPQTGGYRIVGNAPWRPVQAYSENGHTFIEMPASLGNQEAPVLYSLRKAGWFHTNRDIVPYRVHGRWYMADQVIDNIEVFVAGHPRNLLT